MDKRTQAKINAQNVSTNIFKLRKRKISSGYALYYEIYKKDQPRRRRSLHLKIKGTAGAYNDDINTIKLARKKLDKIEKKYKQDENLLFMDNNEKQKIVHEASFFEIFKEYYRKKYKKKTTRKNFITTLGYLKKFNNQKDMKVKDVTKEFSFNFKNYLDKFDLMNNSKNSYLQKYKEVVTFLVENKHIKENPIPKRFAFKSNIVNRQHLEEKELSLLMKTPYPKYSKTVCDAFIFACFTGLRWSDLKTLKFDDIIDAQLMIKQGKTEEYLEFLLPEQALKILNKRQKYISNFVFKDIGDNYRGNKKIQKWVANAGINKKVTWHVARHTFACLLLLKGIDIFHVSKLLGHTDTKSTMKYLHVLKEHKKMATKALSGIGQD